MVLKLVNKGLHNSTLLLNSDNPYDGLILYSFAYEEFGKALIIKDCIDDNKDGLPVWLFTAHDRKMARVKQYLPDECSQFTSMVTLLHPSDIQTTNRIGKYSTAIVGYNIAITCDDWGIR